MRRLLAAGAEVEARDDRGATPLLVAARRGWPDVLTTLLDAGADVLARDAAGATASVLARANPRLRVGATVRLWRAEREAASG